ncbi:unnamed protein product [Gongylonema pulchrum]|uniref:G_PROTEIN_RECEP_F1_2 domain-containing protein n=1 Tax=Gongylonema pulchrum TaxID=637853 RepID=A0A183DNN0_9BILA|nr:unnamed protein product [Gongylonema pulchrum]
MTTGMSVHRYIGVCLPFKASSLLKTARVRIFILALLAFSLLFNITRFFEVRVVNNCFRSNINAFIPVLAPSNLRLNHTYRLIFFGWAYTILMFVMPFSLLIVLNSQVRFSSSHPFIFCIAYLKHLCVCVNRVGNYEN